MSGKIKNLSQSLFKPRKAFIGGMFLYLFISVFAPFALAIEYTGTNFKVVDPVIDVGVGRSTSTTYIVGTSIAQPAVGTSTSNTYQLRGGFQFFPVATAPVLTATAGAGEVSLSWTVSTGYLGWTVTGYDSCYGTSSNSYTCSDVGNVTSKTVTGLTAGTTYYFRIRAKTTFGVVIVRSSEVTAVPTAGAGGEAPNVGGGAPPATPPSGVPPLSEPGKPAPSKLGDPQVSPRQPSPIPSWVDSNKDRKINIIDFAILFFWFGRPHPPTTVDFNNDGTVNIIDFSILMFHWSG